MPVLAVVFSVFYVVLAERLVAGFKNLEPRYCSIYDPYFWWHERYWKLSAQPKILDSTPFKNLAWRLLGVRMESASSTTAAASSRRRR
ncbi:hypothetical protein GCM10009610_06600 [Pseudonocardia xinjiangensis]